MSILLETESPLFLIYISEDKKQLLESREKLLSLFLQGAIEFSEKNCTFLIKYQDINSI